METLKLRLGLVNFLNAFPLYFDLEKNPGDFELLHEVPSVLSELMQAEKLEAAILSSIEYYRHRQFWDYHPGLCISSRGPVESIRLFWPAGQTADKKELKNLQTIYTDYASRSSVEMLKILLKAENIRISHWPRLMPPYEETLDQLGENEAALLIGDPALRLRQRPSLDLGQWYQELFGQPFVYALWVFRRSLPKGQKEQLLARLQESFNAGQKAPAEMIAAASQRFHFEPGFVSSYLQETISYRLDPSRKSGLGFFFEQFEQL